MTEVKCYIVVVCPLSKLCLLFSFSISCWLMNIIKGLVSGHNTVYSQHAGIKGPAMTWSIYCEQFVVLGGPQEVWPLTNGASRQVDRPICPLDNGAITAGQWSSDLWLQLCNCLSLFGDFLNLSQVKLDDCGHLYWSSSGHFEVTQETSVTEQYPGVISVVTEQ